MMISSSSTHRHGASTPNNDTIIHEKEPLFSLRRFTRGGRGANERKKGGRNKNRKNASSSMVDNSTTASIPKKNHWANNKNAHKHNILNISAQTLKTIQIDKRPDTMSTPCNSLAGDLLFCCSDKKRSSNKNNDPFCWTSNNNSSSSMKNNDKEIIVDCTIPIFIFLTKQDDPEVNDSLHLGDRADFWQDDEAGIDTLGSILKQFVVGINNDIQDDDDNRCNKKNEESYSFIPSDYSASGLSKILEK